MKYEYKKVVTNNTKEVKLINLDFVIGTQQVAIYMYDEQYEPDLHTPMYAYIEIDSRIKWNIGKICRLMHYGF